MNAGWSFAKENAVPAAIEENWEVVNLPHTWNAEDGMDGGNDYYRGTACYAKEIVKAELLVSDRYYIEFRGANSSAELYVNGEKKMCHDGGYSTWRCDITEEIAKGEKTLVYPINYGYIPNVLGGDGEELDVFLLGVDTPVESFTGRVIGIVYRADDVEDKLVMSPEGMTFSAQEIAQAVRFQEKYYHTTIRALDGSMAEVER